ncbi:hypothetical protein ACQPZX_19825 [Actinoplanes sp. CA-142083]|uniref:hypothetical protein n=1 Tax=Actinoplanes sp. CA-142083 TaxID=3239903 RepID=UPI003D8F7248
MELPLLMIVAVNQVRRQFEECAPDAPAVPLVPRAPAARQTRAALARGLIRMAGVVAPPEPACR